MVLKEIAPLQTHTRTSEQRIFGSFHGADVCLRPARSRGRESMALANCADRWCQSSSLRQSLPIFHAMSPATATSRHRLARQKRAAAISEKIFRKKCNKTLAYAQMSASIYSGPPPRGTAKRPSGTRSQTGQSLRPLIFHIYSATSVTAFITPCLTSETFGSLSDAHAFFLR